MIDVLDGEIQFVLVAIGGSNTPCPDSVRMRESGMSCCSKKGRTRFQQIGSRKRRLPVIQLGKADLVVRIDERLLVDGPTPFSVPT